MKTAGSDILEKDLFYPEEYFQKLLISERKRTERFGRPFMLMLLDVGPLLKNGRKDKDVIIQNLAFALISSTREIDSKGWYLNDCLVGIICPEFYKADTKWAVDKLRQKLASFLDMQDAANIKIYCIIYPGAEEESAGEPPPTIDKEPHSEVWEMLHS